MSFREYQRFRGGQVRLTEHRNRAEEQDGGFDNSAMQGSSQVYVTSSNLPGLVTAYRSLADGGRMPTKEAYLALLEAAANYSLDRSNTVISAELKKAGVQLDEAEDLTGGLLQEQGSTALGWKLAWYTWEDARRGGIDLGSEGFDYLLRVSIHFNWSECHSETDERKRCIGCNPSWSTLPLPDQLRPLESFRRPKPHNLLLQRAAS